MGSAAMATGNSESACVSSFTNHSQEEWRLRGRERNLTTCVDARLVGLGTRTLNLGIRRDESLAAVPNAIVDSERAGSLRNEDVERHSSDFPTTTGLNGGNGSAVENSDTNEAFFIGRDFVSNEQLFLGNLRVRERIGKSDEMPLLVDSDELKAGGGNMCQCCESGLEVTNRRVQRNREAVLECRHGIV